MDIDTERELIEKAKTDNNAFGELYDRYYTPIFNYTVRRTGDLQTAQDITTETFLKALTKLPTYKWQGAPFSAWLYRIASNEIANHYRNKHVHTLSLDDLMEAQGFEPIAAVNIEQELIAAEYSIARHKQFLTVQQLLKTLPLKYQETLSLRYFEKKTIEEISQITGKKPGTVKSLLSRGLKKLQTSYERYTKE